MLDGLPSRPPPDRLSIEESRRVQAQVSLALGRVDAQAVEAIGRLLETAGLEFVREALARTLLTLEEVRSVHPCGGRLRTFFRFAQRNLSHDAWDVVAPRRGAGGDGRHQHREHGPHHGRDER